MQAFSSLLLIALAALWPTTIMASQATPLAEEKHPRLFFARLEDSRSRIAAAVLKEAYATMGIDAKFLPLPAERAIKESASGRLDGEAGRIPEISAHYPTLIQIPIPVTHFEGVAFVKYTDCTVAGWQSLAPYTIGIRTGSKYLEYNTKNLQTRSIPDPTELFRLLDLGKLDVVVHQRLDGMRRIALLGLQDIRALEPPLYASDLFHYLHKKHEKLVPQITQVLHDMRQSGRIQEITNELLRHIQHESREQ